MSVRSSRRTPLVNGTVTANNLAVWADATGAVKDGGTPAVGTVTNSGTLTANQLIIGGGTTVVSALGTLGTTTTVLHGNAAGAPTFAQVALATEVSGNLPITNLGNGTFTYKTDISTGAQNNLNLTITGDTYVEWSGASDMTVTGVTLGASGKLFIFKNTGTKVAYFSHLGGSSSAANQFTNLVTSNTTPVAPGGWIAYLHNGTNWVMVGHEQGKWITPGFTAGDWTANGSMTVTVTGGDILTDAYRVNGKTLIYNFFTNTMTFGGTASNIVQRVIPGGYTFAASGTGTGCPYRVFDNGTYRTGFAFVYTALSSTQILFTIQDLSNFALSTNNSGLFGGPLTFEVD